MFPKGRLASFSQTFQTGFMASAKRSNGFERPSGGSLNRARLPRAECCLTNRNCWSAVDLAADCQWQAGFNLKAWFWPGRCTRLKRDGQHEPSAAKNQFTA